MKKRIICLVIATIMIIMSFAGCAQKPAEEAKPAEVLVAETPKTETAAAAATPTETKYLTIGSGQASTAIYPYWVAIGTAISSVYPQFQTTVSECQGAPDISYRIRAGEVDIGNGVASTDFDNVQGTNNFEGDPNPDARALWYYGYTTYEYLVPQDAGIDSFKDLDGVKVNYGGTGTAVSLQTASIMDIAGVKPDVYDASKNDAADAYGNRQIFGVSTSGTLPNSFTMQIFATVPSKILPIDGELADAIIAECPYFIKTVIPANTYEGQTEDVPTLKFMQGCQTSTRLSQEDGYLIVKAVFGEGKSEWASVAPAYAAQDEIELALNSPILLHAGMVQYLVEKGVDVPAELIPPEYVAK